MLRRRRAATDEPVEVPEPEVADPGPSPEALSSAVDDLLAGRFDRVRGGDHHIDKELERLARGLQNQAARDMDRMVEFAVGVVEQVIEAAEMSVGTAEIDERVQSIASAAEELMVTGDDISEAADEAGAAAEATRCAADEGASTARSTTDHLRSLADAVRTSAERTTALDQTSAEIEAVVAEIRDLADQTSLLALNASIEAARAGDGTLRRDRRRQRRCRSSQCHGDGADHRTGGDLDRSDAPHPGGPQRATHGLPGRGSLGQRHCADVGEEPSANRGPRRRCRHRRTAGRGNPQRDGRDRLPDRIVRIAKVDHMVWRRKLATMAIGREALNPDELADNHSCRLGKWYDTADSAYRDKKAYRRLATPHELVHQHGIDAARRYERGDTVGTTQGIRAVAEASVDVMRLLEEMIDRE